MQERFRPLRHLHPDGAEGAGARRQEVLPRAGQARLRMDPRVSILEPDPVHVQVHVRRTVRQAQAEQPPVTVEAHGEAGGHQADDHPHGLVLGLARGIAG